MSENEEQETQGEAPPRIPEFHSREEEAEFWGYS
jgi:hypothetical protein